MNVRSRVAHRAEFRRYFGPSIRRSGYTGVAEPDS